MSFDKGKDAQLTGASSRSVVVVTMLLLLAAVLLVDVVSAYEETENTCVVLAIPSLVVDALKAMDKKLKRILPPPPQPDLFPITSNVTALSEEVQSLGRDLLIAVTSSQNITSDTQRGVLSGNRASADNIEAAILMENDKTGILLAILTEQAATKADIHKATLEAEVTNAALISDILNQSARVLTNEEISNKSASIPSNQEEEEDSVTAELKLLAALQMEHNEKLASVLDSIVATADIMTQEVRARAAAEQLRERLDQLTTKKISLSRDNASLKIALKNGPVSPYRARDCWDHFHAGHRTSGVYTIFSSRCSVEAVGLEVWCNMEGMGEFERVEGEKENITQLVGGEGGWTVVLNRHNKYVASRSSRDLKDSQHISISNDNIRYQRNILSRQSDAENTTNSVEKSTISTTQSSDFEAHSSDTTTDSSGGVNYFEAHSSDTTTDSSGGVNSTSHFDLNSDHNYDANNQTFKNSDNSTRGGVPLNVGAASVSHHVNFTRPWEDYKAGFGNKDGEHFIGLTALRTLTASRRYSLLLVVEGKAGKLFFALWRKVDVAAENDKYRLRVGGYSPRSSLPDVLATHHNQQFSTFDSDNDASYSGSCAQVHGGGWWYGRCYDILPTGEWHSKQGIGGVGGLMVGGWGRSSGLALTPVASVRMMIKPRECAMEGGE